MIDTIIVGAGAAGLMAARELVRAGRTVLVLESSDRLGGRVHTLYDPYGGMPIELGAEFVHGEAPLTTQLLDEARLATAPVGTRHYQSNRGRLSPITSTWQHMSRVFSHLDPDRTTDRSFQEFLDQRPGGARLRAARELAHDFVQGFEAADTALISEKSLAQAGDPTEGATQARRIVRGYSALIDHLARDVGGQVRLSSRVCRIVWRERGVRVLDHTGAEHRARTLIVAVPLPMLQDDTLAIEPDVPALRRAANQLVMGHVRRISVVVRERFWEKTARDLTYLHTSGQPLQAWWTQYPLQSPLLVGWSGGPPALTRAGGLDDLAILGLAHAFGMRARRVQSQIAAIHAHDWTLDANIRGAYSYIGVGGASAPRRLARSIAGTIWVAGEATETEAGGTVEAALVSGRRSARQVLRRLAD